MASGLLLLSLADMQSTSIKKGVHSQLKCSFNNIRLKACVQQHLQPPQRLSHSVLPTAAEGASALAAAAAQPTAEEVAAAVRPISQKPQLLDTSTGYAPREAELAIVSFHICHA